MSRRSGWASRPAPRLLFAFWLFFLHGLPEFVELALHGVQIEEGIELARAVVLGEDEAFLEVLVGNAVDGAVEGNAFDDFAWGSADFFDCCGEACGVNAWHIAADEGVFLEFFQEFLGIEFKEGEGHLGCALGVLGVGDEAAEILAVQLGKNDKADGVDFEDDAEFIGVHAGFVGLGFQFDIVSQRIADIEFAHCIVIDMFKYAVAFDEFGRFGASIFMGFELGIGAVDVEIGVAVVRVEFDKDEAPFEIARRALYVMLDEMFGFELGCDQ